MGEVAEALLDAVADGREESVRLVSELAGAVLDNELVRRAAEVRSMVENNGPFVLIRAVELAEAMLTVSESVVQGLVTRGEQRDPSAVGSRE